MLKKFTYIYKEIEVGLEYDTQVLNSDICNNFLKFFDEYSEKDSDKTNLKKVLEICVFIILQAVTEIGNDISLIKDYIQSNYEIEIFGKHTSIDLIKLEGV